MIILAEIQELAIAESYFIFHILYPVFVDCNCEPTCSKRRLARPTQCPFRCGACAVPASDDLVRLVASDSSHLDQVSKTMYVETKFIDRDQCGTSM
jgi:hypothetical protein